MTSVTSSFGQYELVRRLGAGGMAETFLAVRRGPGGFEQHVCLKRILPAFEQDRDFVEQFLAEARLSARLRHTNIAQVIDFGVEDGSHYLALELVEGMDLRGVLRALRREERAMSASLVSHLAFEIASALDFASAQNVVHRDISPSNVLVSAAGEVKLTDFGIAKALNQPNLTQTGIIKGKVRYMPPEYAHQGVYDNRGDLFSLGVTLFECLAGRRPYDGATDLDTIARSNRGEHRPLSSLAPEAPAELVAIIERLIAPNPDDRYPTAGDLLDALEGAPPPPQARRLFGTLVQHLASREDRPDDSQVGPTGPSTVSPDPALEPTSEVRQVDTTDSLDAIEGATVHMQPLPAPQPEPSPALPPATASPTATTRTVPKSDGTPPPAGGAARRRRALGLATGAFVLAAVAWLAWIVVGPTPGETADDAAAQGNGQAADAAVAAEGAPSASQTQQAAPRIDVVAAAPESTTGGAGPKREPGATSDSAAESSATEDGDRPASPRGAEPPSPQTPHPSTAERTAAKPPTRTHARRTAGNDDAVLMVTVIPFGNVWIDGRSHGTSPVRARVSPGTHTVATGKRAPERFTSVQVRAGHVERVRLQAK